VRAQSPAALTAATRLIPRCTGGQLRVRADGYAVGTGHVVDIIGLWERGPGVQARRVGVGGHRQVKRARSFPSRVLNGWGWGGHPTLASPPTVVITHGREGNVVIAGFTSGVTALRARHRSGGCRSPRQEPGW